MNTAEYARALAFYDQHYVSDGLHVLNGQAKIYLNEATPQNCRYCRRVAPAAPFSNASHAFPELIGNRVLFSADECDDCNRRFANFDENLAKVTNFQRVSGRVRGKNGIPAYQSNDKQTEWRVKDGEANISTSRDDNTIIVDHEKKEVRITGQTQPYIPRFAFKSLVKMALAVLPAGELRYFERTLEWLQVDRPEDDRRRVDAKVMVTMIGGGSAFAHIQYLLLHRKNGAAESPHYFFFLGWSHYAYQIFLPFSTQDAHLKGRFTLPFFPTPFVGLPNPPRFTYHVLNWSSVERRRDEKPSVTFKFDQIIETRSNARTR